MTETPPDDPVAFQFFNEVGIIEQLARNQLERALPDDMRMAHFTVLNHLVRLGDGCTPAELASALQVTKGAITNTLQRLEVRRMIEVHPDATDGRSKRVKLTAKGRRARSSAVEAIAPLIATLGERFDDAEFASAIPFLARVRAALDAAR